MLVCGPTGAGKSTTLYACLNDLDSYQSNIITVEDPVEYKMENVNQIEINQRSGQSFAASLRSILRQDPDVVMIGEIRDGETAEIACQAANTGHMVFSTVHANDTITALFRVMELGLEPFMVANSVSSILGQRLARRLCPDCKESYKPKAAVLKKAGLPTKANTKAATTKAELEQWLKRIVFDLKTENRKLELLSSVIFRESAELGGEQAAREAEAPEDFTFNIESPAMKRRLTTQAIKVRKVNRTTQEAIRTVLQRGVNQGRSLAEISEALGDMLGRRAGHGFRIAQTEVHEAISAGRHEGFNQAGIKARRWLSSGLNTVRPSHRDIEAATLRTPVPAGEKFQLIDPEDGSVAEAEYPGDGKLPADERISCSCMLVAAETVSGKQLSDQHYDAVRFVAWRPMHPRKNKKAA